MQEARRDTVGPGPGQHLVLALGPSQLPAVVGSDLAGEVLPRLISILSSHLWETWVFPWPAEWPPLEEGSYACAPISVPGDPGPLFRRTRPERVACLDPLVCQDLLTPSSALGLWVTRALGFRGEPPSP